MTRAWLRLVQLSARLNRVVTDASAAPAAPLLTLADKVAQAKRIARNKEILRSLYGRRTLRT